MKLRNKKTGEITELSKNGFLKSDNDNHIIVYLEGTLKYYAYNSLAELNEEWEDYESEEPIIKVERIRKAVRAWAEANGLFEDIKITSLISGTRFSIGHYDIEFIGYFIYDLESNKTYNITELCGEDR